MFHEDKLEWEAAERDKHERKSLTTYNKCTRFIDKFVELIFIITLTVLGIWNFVQMFVLKKVKFNVWQMV